MVNSFNILFIMYAFVIGFALILSLGIHFVQAYGLSRMAKSCGLKRPWLAWIPVVNGYTIGEVAKCKAVKQRKKPLAYDKLLLILGIVNSVMAVLMIVLYMILMATMMSGLSDESYVAEFLMSPTLAGVDEQSLMIVMLLTVFVALAASAISIVYTVFWYIALWQIFKLFDEKNAVIYLVLSLFVNVAVPIIFIILGKKQPDLTPPPVYGYGYDAYGQPTYGTYGETKNE